jgi:hypothetical protein
MDCTNLAIELLNNVAVGKGAHLSSEMALIEKVENQSLTYLRPLRYLFLMQLSLF